MVLSGADRRFLRRALRRALRWRILRLLLLLLLGLASALEVLRVRGNLAAPPGARDGRRPAPGERVYITSMHFNNSEILRQHWNEAVVRLTEALGLRNVFVSIYESGSWDDSKALLRELEHELARRDVPHRIVLDDETRQGELASEHKGDGWIDTPRNRRELRRIPYLARLRNKTIQDLVDLHARGVTFDKVLFLNDVVFSTEDVLTLMATNGGDYAAACSLDYAKPPRYYDTFALRDSEGKGHVTQTWPYFGARASREAVVGNVDAVPVTSCWNGIVIMAAEPFVGPAALRFRGIADSLARQHLEGSECCLIHADNPLSRTRGVFVNPRVRVGYSVAAYEATHRGAAWLSAWDVFRGLWANRLRRWTAWPLDGLLVRRRVGRWERERAGNREPGEFCLVNEMQVLVDNGWAHV